MAAKFTRTPTPVRVTSTTTQPLAQALEVGEWNDLDALLGIVAHVGAGSVTVELITGMQKDTEDGWVTLVAFSAATAPNTWEKKAGTGLLRFLRWRVSAFSATSASFTIDGMLRSR